MQASSAAYHLIRSSEGLSLTPYQDVASHWTVGYGHLIGDLEPVCGVTYEEAERLLIHDVGITERGIERLLFGCRAPTQAQFDALVSFAFNLGVEALAGSTLLKKFKAGDIMGAAAEFPKWDHAGGKVIAGLAKRRIQERNLFLSASMPVSA